MADTPKVFISYSWTTPDHEKWVVNLAERLMVDGVDIVLDKWDLKEGQDKYSFMESMVKSDSISKVLMIIDKKYAEKANDRSGGVGTETQIITPQIYENISQEKFIPIVAERDEEGKEYMPIYLNGRIYIDLSDETTFEENYELVLRNIFQRPAHKKPTIGKPPQYLYQPTPNTFRTSSIVRSFENQSAKNPHRVNPILRDFLEEFFTSLKGFTITFSAKDTLTVGKEICENINLYTPLRDDYVDFFDKLTKEDVKFDVDIVIKFLEKLSLLLEPQDSRGSWSNVEFDNFRFFIHELFIYSVAAALRNENYSLIAELLFSPYFIQGRYVNLRAPERFDTFYHGIDSIDQFYNTTYSKRYICPMADLIIHRIHTLFTKNSIVEADLLCHHIGKLFDIRWFPITYIYTEQQPFHLFHRMVSLRHYDKIKVLFNNLDPFEFKTLLNKLKTEDGRRHMGYSGSSTTITAIYDLMDIDKIATLR